MTTPEAISEAMVVLSKYDGGETREELAELLESAGLEPEAAMSFFRSFAMAEYPTDAARYIGFSGFLVGLLAVRIAEQAEEDAEVAYGETG